MRSQSEPESAIAIVGMACRLPAAPDLDAYWALLSQGRHGISDVSELDEWNRERLQNLGHAGLLEDVAGFDAPFFRVSPREAEAMDPQQRLLMELSWHALEDAGIVPSRLRGTDAGVYVGISGSGYALQSASRRGARDATQLTGALCSIAANRLSYFYGIHGPSVAVDTACSSSLVAIHLACEELLRGDTELALAGGVSLILDDFVSSTLDEAGVLSPDGRCKSFDARADGYVRGEGGALLVLRPLASALNDGDRIYAVIRGSAVNQDGPSNGLMAPNRVAQEQVIERAWQRASLEPSRADYIEAHGTGTLLGDPIEARALGATVGRGRAGAPCRIGTSKTNIGHLEASAGVAGVVKCSLMMHHGHFVPSLNFEECNPYIPLERLGLDVQLDLERWSPDDDGSRFAGVSSFGIGGTNAHVVLESRTDSMVPAEIAALRSLLPLSASTQSSLEEIKARYARRLEGVSDEEMLWICRSAANGREPLAYRSASPAGSVDEMRQQLSSPRDARRADRAEPRIAFLFTGQGSQYPGMGAELYEREPLFRRSLERCAETLDEHLERPLLEVMMGDGGAELDETIYSQPAIFAVQHALCELWSSWGIRPSAVLGHSVGELAAGCVAGVFDLEDALGLVVARARAMQESSSEGAMLAAVIGEEEAVELLASDRCEVEIAAVNSERQIVFSGLESEIERWAGRLGERGFKCRRLDVRRAFHSALVEPALPRFERSIQGVDYREPTLRFYSPVTGGRVADEIATAAYWVGQARSTVRFADALASLADDGFDVLLEIGSAPILLQLARESLGAEVAGYASLRPGTSEAQQIAAALGGLYERGATPDWDRYFVGSGRRAAGLPLYPFEHQTYWLGGEETRRSTLEAPVPESPRESPQAIAPGDARSLVAARLSAITGHSRDALSPDARLEDLGLSSIDLAELVTALRSDLPVLADVELASCELRSVSDVVELVTPHVAEASSKALTEVPLSGETPSEESERAVEIHLATDAPEMARRAEHRVLASIHRGADSIEAAVVVDQSHPFFFDHPYDHVPGLLFVEAVQQLGEWLGAALGGETLARRLLLDRLSMRFEKWADPQESLKIGVDRLTRRADAWRFQGAIEGEERCARFEARFRAVDAETAIDRRTEAPEPADAQLVHKCRPENVLISMPVAAGEGVEAVARRPESGHLLSEGPSPWISMTQVAEWTRQFLTARAHAIEGNSFDERFILLSLRVDLESPIGRGEQPTLWSPALHSVDTSTLRLGGSQVELRRGDRRLGEIQLFGATAGESQYEEARWRDRG